MDKENALINCLRPPDAPVVDPKDVTKLSPVKCSKKEEYVETQSPASSVESDSSEISTPDHDEARKRGIAALKLVKEAERPHKPAAMSIKAIVEKEPNSASTTNTTSHMDIFDEIEAEYEEYAKSDEGKKLLAMPQSKHFNRLDDTVKGEGSRTRQTVRDEGEKTRDEVKKLGDAVSNTLFVGNEMLIKQDEQNSKLDEGLEKQDEVIAQQGAILHILKGSDAAKAASEIARREKENYELVKQRNKEMRAAQKAAKKADNDKLKSDKKVFQLKQKLQKLEESGKLDKALIRQLKSHQKAPNTPPGEARLSSVASTGGGRRRGVKIPRGFN